MHIVFILVIFVHHHVNGKSWNCGSGSNCPTSLHCYYESRAFSFGLH